jgi:hypothetical protein
MAHNITMLSIRNAIHRHAAIRNLLIALVLAASWAMTAANPALWRGVVAGIVIGVVFWFKRPGHVLKIIGIIAFIVLSVASVVYVIWGLLSICPGCGSGPANYYDVRVTARAEFRAEDQQWEIYEQVHVPQTISTGSSG